MKKEFYYVGDSETNEILGFNLTEKEKDDLFYDKDTKDGHKSATNRFYGAIAFEVEDDKEMELILRMRKYFKNNVEYSYVILNEKNEWLSSGSKESEQMFISTISHVKEETNDSPMIIYEVLNNGITI